MRGVEKLAIYQSNNAKRLSKDTINSKGQLENINMQTRATGNVPPLSSKDTAKDKDNLAKRRPDVAEELPPKKEPAVPETFDMTTKESREKFQKEVEEAIPQVSAKGSGDNMDVDIDIADEFDPTLLGAYAKEIFAYLTVVEKHSKYPLNDVSTSTPAKHIEFVQNTSSARNNLPVAPGSVDYGMNSYHRAKVIDFVSSVHSKMMLCNESIFLCIQFMDRVNYLEGALGMSDSPSKQTGRSRAQKRLIDNPTLLGFTCLFIANKYEDRYSPRLKDFIRYAGNKFLIQDVVEYERRVLKLLDYSLQCPTPIVFLRRYCKIDDTPTCERYMSFLVGEMCFRSLVLSSLRPSLLAAGILGYVNKISERVIWDEKLTIYSNIKTEDVEPVINNIERFIKDYGRSFYSSVKNKYTLSRYHQAWDNFMERV